MIREFFNLNLLFGGEIKGDLSIRGYGVKLVLYICVFGLLAGELLASKACEHASFKSNMKGLSKLTQVYLEDKGQEIETLIENIEIKNVELEVDKIVDGSIRWALPFSGKSVIKIYNQKIVDIGLGKIKFEPNDHNMTTSAQIDINSFEYSACIKIIEPLGLRDLANSENLNANSEKIYLESCDIRAKLYPKEQIEELPNIFLNIAFKQNQIKDELPEQLASVKSKLFFPPEYLDIRLFHNLEKPTWFEWLVSMAFTFDDVKKQLGGIGTKVESKTDYFFAQKVIELPMILRSLIQIPHFDFKSTSYSAFIKDQQIVLTELLDQYLSALRKKRKKGRRIQLPFLYSQKMQLVNSFFEKVRFVPTEKNLGASKKVENQIFEILEIYDSWGKVHKSIEAERTALRSSLPNQMELNSILIGSNGIRSKISISSYVTDDIKKEVAIGVRLDDIPCDPHKQQSAEFLNQESTYNSSDFKLYIPTNSISEMLQYSYDNGLLDILIKESLRFKSNPRAKCKLKTSEIRFEKPLELGFNGRKHNIKIPKADIPGPVTASISSQLETRACNGNLCVRFSKVNADGKLTPVLRFMNLFLLNMIDVNERIEKAMNEKLKKWNTEGLVLIPHTKLIDSIDTNGAFIDLGFKVQKATP